MGGEGGNGGASPGNGGAGGSSQDGPSAPGDRPADLARDSGPDRPADLPADSPPVPDVAPDRPADLPPDMPPPDLAPDRPTEKVALLVVGNPGSLPAPDMQVKARLESKGFRVIVGDDAGPAIDAEMVSLLVVSATVASAMVMGKYLTVRTPALILEAFIFDDMKMTGPTEVTDYGETMASQVNILIPGHPLAAGLTGTITATTAATNFGYGVPAMTAERVATLAGMPTRFAVFGYAAGTPLVGGTPAAGRRVGLFTTSTTAERLNPMGWQLFDAAVDWAMLP